MPPAGTRSRRSRSSCPGVAGTGGDLNRGLCVCLVAGELRSSRQHAYRALGAVGDAT